MLRQAAISNRLSYHCDLMREPDFTPVVDPGRP